MLKSQLQRETIPQFCPSLAEEKWHPLFPKNDTDMTLRSLEGTLYGVSSLTLRKTCGFFATLFTLPPPHLSETPEHLRTDELREPLDVYESDTVLSLILSLLCGLPIPPWGSINHAESVLNLAEKWDAPDPISTIRSTLFTIQFYTSDPLRLYAIARHFDWHNEAGAMRIHTLALNLRDPVHSDILARISSKHISSLLDLHQGRKETFKKLLNSPERFTTGNREPSYCTRCGTTKIDNSTWHAYKKVLLAEIERRPLGDTIGLLYGGLSDCAEARACWEARCNKKGCGGLCYDRCTTLKQIRNCVSSLWTLVEDSRAVFGPAMY
ncbi:hypothetical protein P691DRAFT_673659 [Macrolepiota fuliginosa MF-IS2]|uniref:BTB domain-containing protein n=1 Tax=Macrolepiota fuliginosa MF-IS2 TaxID=1400762 RepID=A0A9P5X7R8_9AGAR|nr:hypothetical protein P691DRAFT_673659 [Macrolepiota fuliginosa MF-IS2]